MGQAHVQTLKDNAPAEVWSAQGMIHKHAVELKIAAVIPYEEFLQSIKELNEVWVIAKFPGFFPNRFLPLSLITSCQQN